MRIEREQSAPKKYALILFAYIVILGKYALILLSDRVVLQDKMCMRIKSMREFCCSI